VAVDNPFAATDVGTFYDRGRPFHHPRTLARAMSLVGEARVERGLDIACGTGMSTIALREHAQDVVGVDVSPEMLRAARRASGVAYLFARAERMPFAAATFDAVTCCSGIHWFDQPRFFAELHRVLRPGAWVVLYDHYFMRVRGTPLFREWIEELFARYPLPPRGAAVGDPRRAAAEGFDIVAEEAFDDDIEMTREEFADYQLTVSHCVAAADRGTPRADLRAWLIDSTEQLFEGSPTKTVRFYAAITCLRRSA
jgi:ubiquinone/menaquinone biosynthesis C-methylase UbiE